MGEERLITCDGCKEEHRLPRGHIGLKLGWLTLGHGDQDTNRRIFCKESCALLWMLQNVISNIEGRIKGWDHTPEDMYKDSKDWADHMEMFTFSPGVRRQLELLDIKLPHFLTSINADS